MSREEDESPEGTESRPRFATLLNRLFLTHVHRDSTGYERPFTLREVAQQTGISIGWLSEARRGNIVSPSMDKVELLATFFGVKPGYFFGEEDDQEPVRGSPALRRAVAEAMEEPTLRQILLRANELSVVERSMVLEVLNQVRGLRRFASKLAGAPPPNDEGDGEDAEETSDDQR